MKITWLQGDLIRFDVDISKADNINNIPFTIEPNAAYGTAAKSDGQLSVGIICKYRVYATNSNNEEVFGYLREFRSTIVEFGSKETALPVLTKFCSDGFVNVEIDFQERMRLPYNIFGRIRPNFDNMGQSILQQLVEAGFYSD